MENYILKQFNSFINLSNMNTQERKEYLSNYVTNSTKLYIDFYDDGKYNFFANVMRENDKVNYTLKFDINLDEEKDLEIECSGIDNINKFIEEHDIKISITHKKDKEYIKYNYIRDLDNNISLYITQNDKFISNCNISESELMDNQIKHDDNFKDLEDKKIDNILKNSKIFLNSYSDIKNDANVIKNESLNEIIMYTDELLNDLNDFSNYLELQNDCINIEQ